jgi:LysR family transcriptional regulator for metE and metH
LSQKSFIEPEELSDQTLITYPVTRDRLDIFTQFLDPAEVEPQAIRTAELTPMMVQLVASGRGVACLPNWALTEYLASELLSAKKLSSKGLWCQLYAAVRTEQLDAPYVEDFLQTAVSTCFKHLTGIKRIRDKETSTIQN